MHPKIYTVEEHKIAPDKIDTHVFYIIQKLREAGHTAYLVGGGVRDLLLGQRPKDFDVSTSAKPEEIKALFRNAILIGRRFRLAHIRFGRKIIEVSTFRSGDTEAAGLIVRDNEWGSEEQDVLRRDFTINGLFYDPEKQTVIDYVGGYPDLEKRVLRSIGQPDIRFLHDPVRIIRLIKFCARFNFDIDQLTFEALLNCKEEIVKSSSARILEELLRMLESGASRPFFHLLHQYGILQPLAPTLARFMEKEDNFIFHLLGEVDAEIKKNPPEPLDRSLLLSALVFPLFEHHLAEKSKLQEKPFHLGQIAEYAHRMIGQIFTPFFKMPRRMSGVLSFILTSQYRLIPNDGRPLRRPRVPRDPLFRLALHFLKWRASCNTELLPIYTLWTEAAFASHGSNEPGARHPDAESDSARPRRRRRRRRRGPRIETQTPPRHEE